MSMNVYIVAEREVSVKKNGKFITDIQRERFDAVQTPTIATYNIVQSEDPIEAYIDYIKSQSIVVKEPVYAVDDIFNERDPVSFEDYDWTVEHIQEFQKWVTEKKWQSYKIKFEVI